MIRAIIIGKRNVNPAVKAISVLLSFVIISRPPAIKKIYTYNTM
jgi:hypothetical protein